MRYRTIWLSDIHLGTRGCKADFLLDFLRHNESDYLYLVGDIIDVWQLKKTFFWPQSHNDVLQKILRKARKGTKVVYVPGNHDEALRDYIGLRFGGVAVVNEAKHTTADGRRFLILHGDKYDDVIRNSKWLAHLGSSAYDVALIVNNWFNLARRKLGYPYWSLSAYLKQRVKSAGGFIATFERTLAAEAKRRGAHGVICGHIHKAEMKDIGGVLYVNDGDWVESCTALVEHEDGALELLEWAHIRSTQREEAAA